MKKLTKVEEEIMQMFWSHGASTVSALIENMKPPKPPHSSISSIVRILEKKGFVEHNTYGRTFEYYAIIDKRSYSRFSIKGLVSQYFEGSMNELVSFLVKEDDLSLKELEELTQRLEESQTKNEKS